MISQYGQQSINVAFGAKALPFNGLEYSPMRFGRSKYDASHWELALPKDYRFRRKMVLHGM